MDTSEYTRHERACLDDLENSQAKIAETLLFHERSVDPARAVLEWLDDGNACLRAEALLIGSWGGGQPRWRWAWANPSLDREARAKTESVRELRTWHVEFDNPEFFEISEQHAWGLAAMACRHLNGQGVYSFAQQGVRWFFVVRGLQSLVPEAELLERAHRRIVELLQLDETPDEAPQWTGVDIANVPEVPDTALPKLTERASALAWNVNALRSRFPQLRLNLANLDLRGATQPWTSDLHVQLPVDLGYLAPRKLRNLHRVDLSFVRLDGAILRGVVLTSASFEGASLVDADFSGADLRGASFNNAFLNGANLTRARLGGADLTGAELSRTILAYVDLSAVTGLDAVRHLTPSEISFSTLVASQFQVTPTFLRQAGVSRGLLEDLAQGQRFPHRYQTCFLSYSSKDREFAERVYASLI
ncbi:MAG: pentapeptide repeat-containing protein, partial [Steroidobacteraceae bacterium]